MDVARSSLGRDRHGHWGERGEKAGDLLIEQVCRAGYRRLPSSGERGDYDLFSTLSAQGHVSPGLLLWESRIDPGLTGEKLLRRLQDFCWTAAGSGFLKRAVAL
jgi:hypothetical protein